SLANGVALFDAASGNSVRVLRTRERAGALSPSNSPQVARDDMLRQAGVDPDQMRQIQEMTGGILGGSPFGAAGPLVATGSSITFSPDGRELTSSGGSAVWDIASGMPRTRPNAPPNAAPFLQGDRIVYSPDGK